MSNSKFTNVFMDKIKDIVRTRSYSKAYDWAASTLYENMLYSYHIMSAVYNGSHYSMIAIDTETGHIKHISEGVHSVRAYKRIQRLRQIAEELETKWFECADSQVEYYDQLIEKVSALIKEQWKHVETSSSKLNTIKKRGRHL